jgi:signal peptidase I
MKATARAASRLTGALTLCLFLFAMGVNTLIIAQGLVGPIMVLEGDSMSPNLMHRDGVILRQVDPENLSPGQVVAFAVPIDPSIQVVHRIVDIKHKAGGTYLVTKGDGNAAADPFLVPGDNISGRVVARLPLIGVFLAFVQSTYGFLVTVIFPFLVVILYVFGKTMQERLTEAGKLSLFFTYDLLPVF